MKKIKFENLVDFQLVGPLNIENSVLGFMENCFSKAFVDISINAPLSRYMLLVHFEEISSFTGKINVMNLIVCLIVSLQPKGGSRKCRCLFLQNCRQDLSFQFITFGNN